MQSNFACTVECVSGALRSHFVFELGGGRWVAKYNLIAPKDANAHLRQCWSPPMLPPLPPLPPPTFVCHLAVQPILPPRVQRFSYMGARLRKYGMSAHGGDWTQLP